MKRWRSRTSGASAVTALALAAVPLLVSGADPGGIAQLSSGAADEPGQAPDPVVSASDVLITGPAAAALTASGLPPTSARMERAGGAHAGKIPWTALQAYQRAAEIIEHVAPSCTLGWPLLAAMGEVGSQHGQQAGTRLRPDGVATPDLVGPALDGLEDRPEIPDSDAGDLDGDPKWDHAVGPMQVLPGVWSLAGVDGDGDGTRSPHDIEDAAVAAAVYLCATDADLTVFEEAAGALRSYYDSEVYAARVLAVEQVYGDAAYEVPESPKISTIGDLLDDGPAVRAESMKALVTAARGVKEVKDELDRAKRDRAETDLAEADRDGVRDRIPTSPTNPGRVDGTDEPATPAPGAPLPEQPSTEKPVVEEPAVEEPPAELPAGEEPVAEEPVAEEPPVEEPPAEEPPVEEPVEEPVVEEPPAEEPAEEPTIVTVFGVWAACGSGYCLDGTPLALDPTAPAASDFDGDGATATVATELGALVGQAVQLTVVEGTSPLVVVAVNGQPLA